MPPRKVEGKPRKKKEGDLKDKHALFSFDTATTRKLESLAAYKGLKKSAVVREAISKMFDSIKPPLNLTETMIAYNNLEDEL